MALHYVDDFIFYPFKMSYIVQQATIELTNTSVFDIHAIIGNRYISPLRYRVGALVTHYVDDFLFSGYVSFMIHYDI